MAKMTMKKALAIGFGGLKAESKDELLAAAAKLRQTRSSIHATAHADRADLLEKQAQA